MNLATLSEQIGTVLEGDATVEIEGLAPIEEAGPEHLTFVANPRYRRWLATSRAGAVILAEGEDGQGRNVLRAANPYAAFVAALALFDRRPRPQPGIHDRAVVDATAVVGEGAYIGPCAVIGENVTIGVDAVVHPHVTVYPGVTLGCRVTLHAGAVLREGVTVGDDVVIQPGAVIGADGFGFLPTGGRPVPIPQIGTVHCADAVEVGANSTVDRATVGATRLQDGVKLDNLVQVGHGSRVGAGSMLAAQTGLAGSTTIGAGVMVGGQAGLGGHLTVGDGARVAGRAGVVGDIEAGRTVGGFPAVDQSLWRRYVAALVRLPELLRRVRVLEKAADGEGGSS